MIENNTDRISKTEQKIGKALDDALLVWKPKRLRCPPPPMSIYLPYHYSHYRIVLHACMHALKLK